MKQVIPVWVINLNKRPDRLKAIAARLDALGIEWTRLEAVDGTNCDKNELNISSWKRLKVFVRNGISNERADSLNAQIKLFRANLEGSVTPNLFLTDSKKFSHKLIYSPEKRSGLKSVYVIFSQF